MSEIRHALAERIRKVRVELFGEDGVRDLARRLGVPERTWSHFESGVTLPAELLLQFMELTSVEPKWLLHGFGPRYRRRQTLARLHLGPRG